MGVEREAIIRSRARGAIMVAVAVGADTVAAVDPVVITLARIVGSERMSDRRLRRTGRSIGDRRDKKRSGDEGHHQNQSRPCRHRPGHEGLDTFIRPAEQSVT